MYNVTACNAEMEDAHLGYKYFADILLGSSPSKTMSFTGKALRLRMESAAFNTVL